MKLRILFCGMMLTVILFTASTSFAQQSDQHEMMKKMMENMAPGPVHQSFAKMSGNWKAVVTMFDPSGKEMKSEGTAVYEMILGGRYLKTSFKSTMMGMPFEGMGLDAYDNATKEYINVWVDNMSTGLMYMKGKQDEKTNSVVYSGSTVDPMSGKEHAMKTVMKMIDDNHQHFTMYMIDGDKEIKQMEIDYTRQ